MNSKDMTVKQKVAYIKEHGQKAFTSLLAEERRERVQSTSIGIMDSWVTAGFDNMEQNREKQHLAEVALKKQRDDQARRDLYMSEKKKVLDSLDEKVNRVETKLKETFDLPKKPLDVKLVHYTRDAARTVKSSTGDPLNGLKSFLVSHMDHVKGVGFLAAILFGFYLFI